TTAQAQSLIVDYRVYYVKKSGNHAPKQFRLRELTLKPGEQVTLTTRQDFIPRSTRALFPGVHTIELVINGVVMGETVSMELD
ncbi:MAG: DNA alkylation repair protein, partial [Anaerolineae bacterium]|nr:DNA alkylation repair protein [Anaerolineae bacterium]